MSRLPVRRRSVQALRSTRFVEAVAYGRKKSRKSIADSPFDVRRALRAVVRTVNFEAGHESAFCRRANDVRGELAWHVSGDKEAW